MLDVCYSLDIIPFDPLENKRVEINVDILNFKRLFGHL